MKHTIIIAALSLMFTGCTNHNVMNSLEPLSEEKAINIATSHLETQGMLEKYDFHGITRQEDTRYTLTAIAYKQERVRQTALILLIITGDGTVTELIGDDDGYFMQLLLQNKRKLPTDSEAKKYFKEILEKYCAHKELNYRIEDFHADRPGWHVDFKNINSYNSWGGVFSVIINDDGTIADAFH